MTIEQKVWWCIMVICGCGVGYWVGSDHARMQYEAQRKLDKALLAQPCIRPGSIKKMWYDMGRRGEK